MAALSRRRWAVLAVGPILTSVLCISSPDVASGDSPGSVVCHGYVACSTGAYSTHGYDRHSQTMYWSMYAGNNCTNYVAFVESTLFGVATPIYRLGDAGQWPGNAASHGALVNHVPTVGSVAEWNGGSPGIPSPGHVAIVEAVGPHSSYIVISQQNVSDVNGYDWVRISADRTQNQWEQWPSNFIHFPRGHETVRASVLSQGVWLVVHITPSRFHGEKLLLGGSAGEVVTPGVLTELREGATTEEFSVRFQSSALQRRYDLLVSVAGRNLRVVRQGETTTNAAPVIGVVATRSTQGPDLITVTVRPSSPSTATTSSPTTTSPPTTTSLPPVTTATP